MFFGYIGKGMVNLFIKEFFGCEFGQLVVGSVCWYDS